jgi:hypothetical protein
MSIANRMAAYALVGLMAVACFTTRVLADTAQQNPITVTVDGQQVNFNGPQPMETAGSVLVPLRGVFQALGAHVDYDMSTNTVTADRGSRTVSVPIGSSTATIDGQPQQLSQPAEIYNGVTMVPLRFVAEALGDYVEWEASTQTVAIQRQHDIVLAHTHPMIPANPVISGTIRRIIVDVDSPSIVVRSDGEDQTIVLSRDATILRGAHRDSVSEASLSDLQPGDHVWIHENQYGHAASITAVFGAM